MQPALESFLRQRTALKSILKILQVSSLQGHEISEVFSFLSWSLVGLKSRRKTSPVLSSFTGKPSGNPLFPYRRSSERLLFANLHTFVNS